MGVASLVVASNGRFAHVKYNHVQDLEHFLRVSSARKILPICAMASQKDDLSSDSACKHVKRYYCIQTNSPRNYIALKTPCKGRGFCFQGVAFSPHKQGAFRTNQGRGQNLGVAFQLNKAKKTLRVSLFGGGSVPAEESTIPVQKERTR